MNLVLSRFLAYLHVGLQVALQMFIYPCHLHPQPCHILARIGHTVRLGALLPTRQQSRIQGALNRALVHLRQSGNNFLPYNLSLEVLSREPLNGDPESMFRCVCQDIVVQGVSAVLAFPQSHEELIQVEFMSSFLEIPFISIIEQGEPLKTQVSSKLIFLYFYPKRCLDFEEDVAKLFRCFGMCLTCVSRTCFRSRMCIFLISVVFRLFHDFFFLLQLSLVVIETKPA